MYNYLINTTNIQNYLRIYPRATHLMLVMLMLLMVGSCRSEPSEPVSEPVEPVEPVELEDYETLVAQEEMLLAQPYLLNYDNEQQRLFVYDLGQVKVWELDRDGTVIHEYAREGRGPGELLIADKLYLTQSHLYIYDPGQHFIHRYERGGSFDSSLSIELAGSPGQLDSSNRPVVTLNGHLLRPSGGDDAWIYGLTDWEGNYLAYLGETPEGSLNSMDDRQYLAAIESQQVPAMEYTRAFPVIDQANPDEFFLVYSATARIEKYNVEGEKLWERQIPLTPEVEAVSNDHFELYDWLTPGSRLPLRRYVSGTSTQAGDLYLAVYNNFVSPVENRPFWIHRFDAAGKLTGRFKLISDPDIDLLPTFSVDTEQRRFYVPTFEDGEIRAYPF